MTRDLWTMVWKEWKEIFLQRGTLRGGVFTAIALPLGMLGVFIPWQEGPCGLNPPRRPCSGSGSPFSWWPR